MGKRRIVTIPLCGSSTERPGAPIARVSDCPRQERRHVRGALLGPPQARPESTQPCPMKNRGVLGLDCFQTALADPRPPVHPGANPPALGQVTEYCKLKSPVWKISLQKARWLTRDASDTLNQAALSPIIFSLEQGFPTFSHVCAPFKPISIPGTPCF